MNFNLINNETWLDSSNITSIVSNTTDLSLFLPNSVTEKHKHILMVLRGFGVLTGFLNVSVLVNPKLKDPLFKYLLVISIVDTTYSLMIYFLSFLNSLCFPLRHEICGPIFLLIFRVLFMLMSDFLTSSLAFMNILLEIFLTLQRVLMITNTRSVLRDASVARVCWTLFSVSVLVYFPFLFTNKVERVVPTSSWSPWMSGNSSSGYEYRRVKSEFGNSTYAFWFQVTVNVIRMCLVLVVLPILNCLAIIKFHAYFQHKYITRKISKLIRIFFYNDFF
jgi:hypothetical protein